MALWDKRRVKVIRFSVELLVGLCIEREFPRHFRLKCGLPNDASAVDIWTEHDRRIAILVHSKSFEPVEFTTRDKAPEFIPIFESIHS